MAQHTSPDPRGRAHPQGLRSAADILGMARLLERHADRAGVDAVSAADARERASFLLSLVRAADPRHMAEPRQTEPDGDRLELLRLFAVKHNPSAPTAARREAARVLRGVGQRARKQIRRRYESPATRSVRLASRGRTRCPRVRRSTSSSSRTSCQLGGDEPPLPELPLEGRSS